MSVFKNRETVKYAESTPYQKADGYWYVIVTIDNVTQVEQRIASVPQAPKAIPAEPEARPDNEPVKRKPGRPPKAKS